MKATIDKAIYDLPEVGRAMAAVGTRSNKEEVHYSVSIREGWKPGMEATIFCHQSEDRLQGCVEIYNTEDGRTL